MNEKESSFLLPELEELDELVKCGICYEHMQTPVMTSCSHTFCSLCIRKSLSYKQSCPTCASDVQESTLRKNLIAENFITLLSALNKSILKLFKNGLKEKSSPKATAAPLQKIMPTSITNKGNTSSVSPKEYQRESPTVSKKRVFKKHPVIFTDSDDSDDDFKPTVPKTPTSSTKKVHLQSLVPKTPTSSTKKVNHQTLVPKTPTSSTKKVNPQSPSEASTLTTPMITKVPCPVCGLNMPEREINVHLDLCLTGGRDTRSNTNSNSSTDSLSAKQHSAAGPSKSKSSKPAEKDLCFPKAPIRQLVYNLLSDAQVKKELRSHGLPVHGDRYALVKRLKKFVVMYNAECDARNPRSVLEIKQALEKEEKAQSMPVATTSLSYMFKTLKTHDEARRDYMQQNKSSYDSLIQQIKQRQGDKKKRKAQCIESDSEDEASHQENEIGSKEESIETHADFSNVGASTSTTKDKPSKSTTNPLTKNTSDDSDSASILCISDDDDDEESTQRKKSNDGNLNNSSTNRKQSDVRKCVDSDTDFEHSPVLSVRKTDLKQPPPKRSKRQQKKENSDASLNTRPLTRRQSQLVTNPPKSTLMRDCQGRGQEENDTKVNIADSDLRSPTPDLFEETTPSPVSSDIQPGQRTIEPEDDSDQLSQLVSLMNESSTDFED